MPAASIARAMLLVDMRGAKSGGGFRSQWMIRRLRRDCESRVGSASGGRSTPVTTIRSTDPGVL